MQRTMLFTERFDNNSRFPVLNGDGRFYGLLLDLFSVLEFYSDVVESSLRPTD